MRAHKLRVSGTQLCLRRVLVSDAINAGESLAALLASPEMARRDRLTDRRDDLSDPAQWRRHGACLYSV